MIQTNFGRLTISSPDLLPSFDWLHKVQIQEAMTENQFSKEEKNLKIKNLNFYSIAATPAGEWKSRKEFIEKILTNICESCPKNEPFSFISMGSAYLLMEYLVAKGLIENGFSEISFFLIDPIYVNPKSDKQRSLTIQTRVEFKKQVDLIYKRKYNKNFPENNIRFLGSIQEIEKYFEKSNFVFIEVLPPHAKIFKELQSKKIKEKRNPFVGNTIVSSTFANAISFIPVQLYNMINPKPIKGDILPLSILERNKKNFYIDWGTRIFHDGTFQVSFQGKKEYVEATGLSGKSIYLLDQTSCEMESFFDHIQKEIEDDLTIEMQKIKEKDPEKKVKLSQEKRFELLERVNQIMKKFMGETVPAFFLRDYSLDRKEGISSLFEKGVGNYKKNFRLEDQVGLTCSIIIEDLSI